MNNNDISYLMNMLNKMDKNQLANGLNQLNSILSPADKQRILQALNNNNNNNNKNNNNNNNNSQN